MNLNKAFSNYYMAPILSVEHTLGLTEQKIWHAMLLFAHGKLLTQATHTISIDTLLQTLSLPHQEIVIRKLNNMALETATPHELKYCFANLTIVGDTLVYQYPDHLKILLSHPYVYEVTKKLIDMRFESKYSLFFYEFCLYWHLLSHLTFIPNIAFRRYFGLKSAQYGTTKTFLNAVLIKAIHEITAKAGFSIAIRPIREAKSTAAFRLDVQTTATTSQITLSEQETAMFVLQNIALFKSFYILNETVENVRNFNRDHYLAPSDHTFAKNLVQASRKPPTSENADPSKKATNNTHKLRAKSAMRCTCQFTRPFKPVHF